MLSLSYLRGAVPDSGGVEIVGPDVEVDSLEIDSRSVRAGQMFACVRGANFDGHSFAQQALDRGASALLVDHRLEFDVAQLVVRDVRAALGPLSAALAANPSAELAVVGVTGTNGKTTVVTLLQSIFDAARWSNRSIGTLTGARTTPEAHQLQPLLATFLEQGTQAVAMEVSSHALSQGRVDGLDFAVAVFTNLTQDHLDFHSSMAEYFEAKALLFDPARCGAAVINADDPAGRELIGRWDKVAPTPARAYGLGDVTALRVTEAGARFVWRGRDVELPLLGRYNVSNALAAANAALALGIIDDDIVAGLQTAHPAPGRMEPVGVGQPFSVLVDYAHTPDALRATLLAARELRDGGRVIVVFGCGGDRDPTKRVPMGAAAADLAVVAILTDDNPRSENPADIRAAVLSGMVGPATIIEEPNRRSAIGLALRAARAGDVVVVAGKGHEVGQTVAGVTTPFDDRVVVREELENR